MACREVVWCNIWFGVNLFGVYQNLEGTTSVGLRMNQNNEGASKGGWRHGANDRSTRTTGNVAPLDPWPLRLCMPLCLLSERAGAGLPTCGTERWPHPHTIDTPLTLHTLLNWTLYQGWVLSVPVICYLSFSLYTLKVLTTPLTTVSHPRELNTEPSPLSLTWVSHRTADILTYDLPHRRYYQQR